MVCTDRSILHGGSPGAIDTSPGDANRDGIFNSSDLVHVFQIGEYEDDIAGNSTFESGDWNGDGDFTTRDLVLAFQYSAFLTEARLWERGRAGER